MVADSIWHDRHLTLGLPPRTGYPSPHAGVAQLVERQLPKLDVAGSNPVARSVATAKAGIPMGCRPFASAATMPDAVFW